MNINSEIKSPKVIDYVINNDLCTGCGLCVYSCPNNVLKMDWNSLGFLNPVQINNCDGDGVCLKYCPFNPFPEKIIKTENELSDIFLSDSIIKNKQIGRFEEIYVGHSKEFRLSSSSGGVATYIMNQLFENDIIDAVITVKAGDENEDFFKYGIIKDKSEVSVASKTRYYPVTMASALKEIDEFNGRIAIVGVACFIKAIRIAQFYQPELNKKIVFTIGIICGGLKSKFFTEYLGAKIGVDKNSLLSPEYRQKNFNSNASDYSFSCINKDTNTSESFKMKELGDVWGTGLFKANACDFCDDVTSELADISLGDAWIQPFDKDGKGTNVIVARSKISEEIIKQGIDNGNLNVDKLSLEKFLRSQQGSFNHRHKGLLIRIKLYRKKGFILPPKRDWSNYKSNFGFSIVQYFRMKVRKMSLEVWRKYQNKSLYDNKMNKDMLILKKMTMIYHLIDKISFNSIYHRIKSKYFIL